MDIQSGYYEAGIVLFWLLFAYLFMEKFLFRGQLGEICFGKARRRMAKALRGAAGWFDPVKEDQKKGRKRTKGKTEKKESPAVLAAEKRDMPAVKTEVRNKEKQEMKDKEKAGIWKIHLKNGLKRTALSLQKATVHANSRQ